MWIRQNRVDSRGLETISWISVQNQLEQDEIAKEPASIANNPFRKLPTPLMDKIRWYALGPTPSANIMKDVSMLWNVSRYGPKRGMIQAMLPLCGAVCFRKIETYFGTEHLKNRIFKIIDTPQDAEPTNGWLRVGPPIV